MLTNNPYKMLNKAVLPILFLLCCGQHLLAQEMNLSSEIYTEHRYYPLKGEIFYKAYRQVKGNAYLTDGWVDGSIYMTNGSVLKSVKFKIDVYAHYLLVYNEYLKRVIVLPRSEIDKFNFMDNGNNRKFKRVKANRNLKLMNNEFLLEVIQQGHVSVYKLYYRDITPMKSSEMPFIDEFVPRKSYFLVYNNNWEGIRLRRSSLNKKFPDYKKEIKHYIRKNRLKLKRENDFAQVVDYISQILELVDSAD